MASDKLTSGPNTFVVHSLGWMEFDEVLLTPATSSKAIQRCIVELSTRGDNAARCWGKQDTQQLIAKVENSHLKLYDMATNKLLNLQPINGIRVWGVNDNNDFAYVARDPPPPMVSNCEEQNCVTTPISPSCPFPVLKCHVFHCENENSQEAAQQIANILKDEMIRIRTQSDANGRAGQQSSRPQHLYIDDYNPSPITTPTTEFPTPIEEPRKTIVAKYLGNIFVSKPVGINVLNEAIDKVKQEIRSSQSCSTPDSSDESQQLMDEYVRNVISLVHVSPSNITIESTVNGQKLLDCRVRYLSFLGIHKTNVKNCGFIVQINDSTFEAHCFECEPNSAVLCKAIEAACKLRYQKCLDAHKQRTNAYLTSETAKANQATQQASGTRHTLAAVKNVFSKLWYK